MKAEDYVCEWCDKTYRGGKELGDWTTKEVMKFANDFAEHRLKILIMPDVGNSLNLREFERKLDEALGKETRQTLTEWLKQQRQ